MPPRSIKPFWQTTDGTTAILYCGDVLDVLRKLKPSSVHSVITSPPYWQQRDYQTGNSAEIGLEPVLDCGAGYNGEAPCDTCHVCAMRKLFKGLRRVLRQDGTVWFNYGDCYVNGNQAGIPWRIALALQNDGWIVRQDIIWQKSDPMPEPVKNRCTKSHEHVLLLTKGKRYYYDSFAIREQGVTDPDVLLQRCIEHKQSKTEEQRWLQAGKGTRTTGSLLRETNQEAYGPATRNKPDVWRIAKEGYPGLHFATFPRNLVRPCMVAGTSEGGCCENCGAPLVRKLDVEKLRRWRPNELTKRTGQKGTGNYCPNTVAGVSYATLGWERSCDCTSAVVPCTVLDPFVGSGTTSLVAIELGRRSIGIDLSREYLQNHAKKRIQAELLGRPRLANLVGKQAKKVSLGRTI